MAVTPSVGDTGRRARRIRDRGFVLGLALICVLGLVLRLVNAFVWLHLRLHAGDAAYFHGQANAMAKGHFFVDGVAWSRHHALIPSALHPPAYPVFLSIVSFLGGTSARSHRLASCLLGTSTIVVLGVLGRSIAGRRTGLLVALVAALTPALWIADSQMLSEGMYGLALALTLYAAYRYRSRPTVWAALGLGAAVSLASLTRGEALFLFPFLVLPLVVLGARRRSALLQHVGAVIVVAALMIGPWLGFNAARFGRVTLSNNTGVVLMLANCRASYHGTYLGYWTPLCYRPSTLHGDEAARDAKSRTVAIDYMRDHESGLSVAVLARVGRMLEVFRVRQNIALASTLEGRGLMQSRLQLWSFYALALLAIPGVVAMRRLRIGIWPVACLALLAVLTAAMTYGNPRFRMPLDVALVVAAGIGIAWLTRERGADLDDMEAAAA